MEHPYVSSRQGRHNHGLPWSHDKLPREWQVGPGPWAQRPRQDDKVQCNGLEPFNNTVWRRRDRPCLAGEARPEHLHHAVSKTVALMYSTIWPSWTTQTS